MSARRGLWAKKIESDIPPTNRKNLSVYEADQPVAALRKLNANENADSPRRGIRFTNEEDSHDRSLL